MRFIPSWERQQYTQQPQKESDPTVFDEMQADKFASVVNKLARSNSDVQAETLSQVDSWSFQIANPSYKRTEKNKELINHWLRSQGIKDALYPDFQAAFDALTAEGLLSLDKTAKTPSTFKGAITGREYSSLDTMILQEREAALHKVPAPTELEIEFDNLPWEQQQRLLKQGQHGEQLKANALQTQKNANAWVTLNPWYVDSTHNAKLLKMQLAANGASDNNASIEQFDVAANQLRNAGMLTVNPKAVAKEHAAEVLQLAEDHKARKFNLEEAEMLPLDEIRRRAAGNFSGR